MWKLHRYYLREVAASSALTFAVLFGIVLISLIARGIERAQGGDLLDAAVIVLLWAADTFPHLLAMALLFGTVLVFARASQDREITAIRSAGISPRVPMTSALLVGIVFTLLGVYALHYVIPLAHFYKYRVIAEATRNVIVNLGMQGDQLDLARNGVMTWERKDADHHFHDVVIHLSRGSLDGAAAAGAPDAGGRLYTASEAWFEVHRARESLALVLRELREPATGAFLDHGRLEISLRRISEQNRRTEGDRDLGSDQLLAEVYRGVHPAPGAAQYTVHRRSCFALLPCLFAPIGFCIGVMARERGRMTALVFALPPLLVFYTSDILGQKLVQIADLPVFGWLPAAVLTVLGIPFCWRLLRL